MPETDDVVDLVGRLVSIHGEGGICPSAADWRAIFALNGAIHILNLLKFRQWIDTPNGPIAGADGYAKYSSGVAGAFGRAGGERVFFGRVGHSFAFGTPDEWDAAIVSAQAGPTYNLCDPRAPVINRLFSRKIG